MNWRKIFSLLVASLIVLVIFIIKFLLDEINLAKAATSDYVVDLSHRSQILPTATPQFSGNEEVLVTNPALLQVMIILSIIAVLVIFGGVWINRHKLDLR